MIYDNNVIIISLDFGEEGHMEKRQQSREKELE